MKIFVFEFITGGGLVEQDLPAHLAHEGELMLNALVNDLLAIDTIEVFMSRDYRLAIQERPRLTIIPIHSEQQFKTQFNQLIQQTEATFPIAPETNQQLFNCCVAIETAQKKLLSSASIAVKITGDKLMTYQYLKSYHLPMLESHALIHYQPNFDQQAWVIKPIDGVGCESCYLIDNHQDYQKIIFNLACLENYLIQAYIKGRTLSLSALFHQGKAELLSLNEQQMTIKNQQFQLNACQININNNNPVLYRRVLNKMAIALPDLRGYVGIDFIETPQGIQILDINPRLTSSYVGLSKALGFNVAMKLLSTIKIIP